MNVLVPLLAGLWLGSARAESRPLCERALARGFRLGTEGTVFYPSHLWPAPTVDFLTLESIDRLFRAVADQGITLVAVVIPTVPMAVPEQLEGVDLADPTWSAARAAADYRALLRWLEHHGVRTVDVLDLALGPALKGAFFLQRDLHWTPAGARATAGAVASVIRQAPAYGPLPKTEHITRPKPPAVLPSGGILGERIHQLCGTDYPDIEYQSSETQPVAPPAIGLLDEAPPAPVVLTGTSFSQPRFNFVGFLSEELSLDVLAVTLSGGNALSGLLTYFESPEYEEDRPKFIVWEFPYYTLRVSDSTKVPALDDQNLYRQLVPAVYGACDDPVRVGKVDLGAGENPLFSDPHSTLQGESHYLYLETTDLSPGQLTVQTRYAGGHSETFEIARYARIEPRGRYFMAFSADEGSPIVSVAVDATEDAGGTLSYRVCAY